MSVPQSNRGVVAVAIKFGSVTISMPAPARHGDVQIAAQAAGFPLESVLTADQGFLDHRGLFLDRKSARVTAERHGQIEQSRDAGLDDLFSEDVW